MRYLLAFICFLQVFVIKAQHTVDFTIPAQVCIGEFVRISNASDPGVSSRWDFCSGQLDGTYSSSTRPTIVGNMTDITIVEDGGMWYGFVTGRNNVLLRLNFGNNPNNNYTITNLGNPGNLLTNPEGISMVKEGGEWFGLVTLLTNNEIIRLKWGSDLLSTPSAESLNLSGFNKLKNPIQIDVVFDGSTYTAVVVNSNTSSVSLINFNSSIKNNPVNADVINSPTFPGAADMQGVSVSRQCDQWYLYAVATNRIYRVTVGSDLFSTITLGQIDDFTADVPIAINAFNKIETVDYGGSTYAYFTSYGGNYLSAIKWVVGESSPEFINVGVSVPGNPFSLETFRYNDTYGLYVGGFGGAVSKISIAQNCYAATRLSNEIDPEDIAYSQAGTYPISLTVSHSDGTTCSLTKEITVTGNTAPLPTITNSSNVCAPFPVSFEANILNGVSVSGWDWDFGTGTSTDDNPEYTFTNAGLYTVNLRVTSPNGCANEVSKTLKMYNTPVADFTLPAGLLCTNGEITFINNTTDNFDGYLSYQWYVEGNPASTSRDLERVFVTTGAKTIKLETSIPGCSDDVEKVTSAVQTGPAVDFSFAGICEGTETQFTSIIGETISSRNWDFDDGGTSPNPDPSHLFATPGTYAVSLTALSPSGCNNTKTKTITVRSRPTVDFSVGVPPYSCSNTSTSFTNLTADPIDSDITSWQWNFDDPASPALSDAKSPSHTFANAGTYNVTLTATTDFGCFRSLQKPITIAQSPTVSIGHSLACNSRPVNFTSTGNNILTYYWEMGTSYYEVPNPVHTFGTSGDHLVKLVVKGTNVCETTYNTTVSIPIPLVPDFSVSKNCVGTDAIFTDVTSGADVVTQRTWDFSGLGSATSSPALFKFTSTGNRNIKLSVTGQSGCSYSAAKTVSIATPPAAGFTATPETGASPLSVQFTNTSSNAAQYAWTFGDGTGTSAQASPAYVFQQTGEFVTTLIATSIEGCESSMSKTIRSVAPQPDVDLRTITMSENADGTLKVIITLQNNGNTFLKDLPVYVDISGNVMLREMVQGPIAPSALYNIVLSYGLAPANVSFLCARADLQNDFVPNDNRICTELNEKTSFINPYPNPAKDILHVEWVAPAKTAVSILLVDAFGKKMLENNVLSADGLNHFQLDVGGLQNGIYLLVFRDGTVVKTQKVLISAEN